MARAPFYETVYHRKDYILADAFRPQPGWGKKSFTTPVSAIPALPALTDDALTKAAKEAAPEGYHLTKLSLYPDDGPERVIWSTPPVKRSVPHAASQGDKP